MAYVQSGFTFKEVYEALKQAGWEEFLPPDINAMGPLADQICVFFCSQVEDDGSDDDDNDFSDFPSPTPNELAELFNRL